LPLSARIITSGGYRLTLKVEVNWFMTIAPFSVLLIVLGLLVWYLTTRAEVKETGKIMFFWGVGILAWSLRHYVVQIG
jgi:hypothetical protein